MALISKTHTFSGGTVISHTQVNTNFDDLYNTLSGSDTTTRIAVVSSDGNTPLTLNQQSANYTQEWQDNGTTRLRILKSGVAESLVTTGTAPFIVASSTVVTNLNADMLDGLNSSDFAVFSGDRILAITGDVPKIALTNTSANNWGIRAADNDTLIISDDTGTQDVITVTTAGAVTTDGNVSTNASAPSAASHLTRKDYVDDRLVQVAVVGFFPGAASTSAPRPSFIVPENVVGLTFRKMKIVFQAGTASGTTTLQWNHNGVDKETQSIVGSDNIGDVVTRNIADITVVADDVVYFKITAAGSQADITVQLIGDMKVTS